jgi:hypothetical protein
MTKLGFICIGIRFHKIDSFVQSLDVCMGDTCIPKYT